MPSGWMHATVDLVAFGKPHFDLHKEKDKAHKTLGSRHRSVNHSWYHEFGKSWTYDNPFPLWLREAIKALREEKTTEIAEQQMVILAHDCLDKFWDTLSYQERKYWESFFIWVLSSPDILMDWAGVDVINGKIKRQIDSQEIWESSPETRNEYIKLCRYVRAVETNDPILQEMLFKYG